jgi:hypothetical protein
MIAVVKDVLIYVTVIAAGSSFLPGWAVTAP